MAITPRPIYRNSSFAPTRGTNNPQGYIMRELAKRAKIGMLTRPNQTGAKPATPGKTGPYGGVSKFGSTGRSETRSGLAKRAMSQNQGVQAPNRPRPVGGSGHSGDPKSLAQSHLMRLLGIRG